MMFENEIFNSFPLTGTALTQTGKEHGGSLAHWVGDLMHIATQSHPDIAYGVMRMSGYMSCPKLPIFQALHQCMSYLYHHPHITNFKFFYGIRITNE